MTHFRETRKRRIYLAVADYYERKHRDSDPTAGIKNEKQNDNFDKEVVENEN